MANAKRGTDGVWKIALYIRLSREDGNDESMSVSNQRKILHDFVQTTFGDGALTEAYVDDGKTGTDVNRPEFQRMERDIRDKRVNCVIVKSLARAFRNLGDQQKYLEEFFPLYGVRFINLGNPFIDTQQNPRAVTGLEVPIHGMFNEQYAASTSEEVRKTFDAKRKAGEFIGAFAPYGYAKAPDNKNRLIVDDEAASVVRDIFTWYVYGLGGDGRGGVSIGGVAKELNERGIPCPSRYKRERGLNYCNPAARGDGYWNATTVSAMLKNRVYTGAMVQGRSRVISYKVHKQIATPEDEWFVVENTHEAIIGEELFQKAQERLQTDTRESPVKAELHIFAGFLFCEDCKRSLHRKSAGGRVYYYCRTHQLCRGACAKRSIREDALEAALLAALRAQFALADFSEAIGRIERAVRKDARREDALRKRREHELARLNRLSDGLYPDWKEGHITFDEYARMKQDYACRAAALEAAMAAFSERADDGDACAAAYCDEFLASRNITSLRRDLLADLLTSASLCADGSLVVRFAFADPSAEVFGKGDVGALPQAPPKGLIGPLDSL